MTEDERERGARAIVQSFAETFCGGGWADPLDWNSFDEAGHERHRQAYDAAAAIARESADAEIALLQEAATKMVANLLESDAEIARLREALSDARRVAVSDLHSDRALVSIINRIDAALNKRSPP